MRKVNTKETSDMKGIFLCKFLWEKHANYCSVFPLVRCSYCSCCGINTLWSTLPFHFCFQTTVK